MKNSTIDHKFLHGCVEVVFELLQLDECLVVGEQLRVVLEPVEQPAWKICDFSIWTEQRFI